MARSLSSFAAQASLGATLANTLTSLSSNSPSASAAQLLAFKFALSNGTTANAADRVWVATRSLVGATSENIDLYDLGSLDIGAGAGLDALGQAWSIAELVGLMVINATTSTGTITIGGEGSGNAWNSAFGGSDSATFGPIGPGGCVFALNPVDPAWAVADSSNHLLKIASSANVTYSICLLGRSA